MLKDRSKRLEQYITIAVTKKMYDELYAIAEINGKPLGMLCRELLTKALADLNQEDPDETH